MSTQDGIPEIRIAFDVPCTLPDGTILRANVYSPCVQQTLPVIVLRHPYNKNNPNTMSYLDLLQIARAGYIVVVQDVRGRFASDGVFQRGAQEQSDAAAVIEWATQLPGSNGAVGTVGGSNGAAMQWSAALADPPALRSMVTVVSPSHSVYAGHLFRGGAHEFGSRLAWAHGAMGLEETRRRLGDDPAAALRAHSAMRALFDSGEIYRIRPFSSFPAIEPFVVDACKIFDDNSDHGSHSLNTTIGRYDRIRPRVFLIGGWYDVFLGSTLQQYSGVAAQATRTGAEPPHLVIGPWSHSNFSERSGELAFGVDAAATTPGGDLSLTAQHVRWFDATLKGRSEALNGVAPVRIFVMGRNEWLELEEFPPRDAIVQDWYADSDGTLSPEKLPPAGVLSYRFNPDDPAPTIGGATLMSPPYAPGAMDQRPLYARDDVLSFTSDPLAIDVTVIGEITVTLFASSSAVDTDFVARLCDVHPDGRSIVIADGIVRASLRNHDPARRDAPFAREPIVPGQIYDYQIGLFSTANTFLVGHRIRLDITSSSFPRWDPNPNTGRTFYDTTEYLVADQSVHVGGDHSTRISLPVVQCPRSRDAVRRSETFTSVPTPSQQER